MDSVVSQLLRVIKSSRARAYATRLGLEARGEISHDNYTIFAANKPSSQKLDLALHKRNLLVCCVDYRVRPTGRVRRSWELDYFMLLNNMRLPYGIVAFEFDLPDEIGSFKTIVYCCKLDWYEIKMVLIDLVQRLIIAVQKQRGWIKEAGLQFASDYPKINLIAFLF